MIITASKVGQKSKTALKRARIGFRSNLMQKHTRKKRKILAAPKETDLLPDGSDSPVEDNNEDVLS